MAAGFLYIRLCIAQEHSGEGLGAGTEPDSGAGSEPDSMDICSTPNNKNIFKKGDFFFC